MLTDPSSVFVALATALAPHLRTLLSTETASARVVFSQREGQLPCGSSRERFLRIWRRAIAANDEGAWSEGRARLITGESWSRWSRTPIRARDRVIASCAVTRPAPKQSVDEEVLAALGAIEVTDEAAFLKPTGKRGMR